VKALSRDALNLRAAMLRSSCHRRPTTAFTLVELLVVIAIIGVLVSLLLPAVQMAREAARKVECSNKLRQLGLAVQSFVGSNKALPAAGYVGPPINPTDGDFDPREYPLPGSQNNFGWLIFLLPYLEEQSVYDEFDFTMSAFAQPKEPQSRPISFLTCPSDKAFGRVFQARETNSRQFSKGNYAGFASAVHISHLEVFPGALGGFRSPVMFSEKGQNERHIKDGFAKTLLASEVRTRSNDRDQRGAWALPWSGSSLLSADVHPEPTCPNYEPLEQWKTRAYVPCQDVSQQADRSQTPNQQVFFDVIYLCNPLEQVESLLDRMPCTRYAGNNQFWSAAPRSQHPGGVFVVFLDGHIHFMPDEIDYQTFALLVHRSDGQVLQYRE
jgi:prepilin-type N-terminal cleavage/methylation domain-containing protein